MGQHLKLISIFLKIWSAASPFIAAMYLVVWTFQFANEELFTQLDMSIGFLPLIFDLIHPVINLLLLSVVLALGLAC